MLTDIEEGGQQLHVLRDNMPFGEVGKGDFGNYFIGYARSPDRIEKILNNMFIGNPPGNYDRILDVSVPLTGTEFFVPSLELLEALPDRAAGAPDGDARTHPQAATPHDATTTPTTPDGSLSIGSLRGSQS